MNIIKNNATKYNNNKNHESIYSSVEKKHAVNENSLNGIEDKRLKELKSEFNKACRQIKMGLTKI